MTSPRLGVPHESQSYSMHVTTKVWYADHSGRNQPTLTILTLQASKARSSYRIPDFSVAEMNKGPYSSLGLCYQAYPINSSKFNQTLGVSKAVSRNAHQQQIHTEKSI